MQERGNRPEPLTCTECEDVCRRDRVQQRGWQDITPTLRGPVWLHLWLCPYCAGLWLYQSTARMILRRAVE